jgi:hypothetical protein
MTIFKIKAFGLKMMIFKGALSTAKQYTCPDYG